MSSKNFALLARRLNPKTPCHKIAFWMRNSRKLQQSLQMTISPWLTIKWKCCKGTDIFSRNGNFAFFFVAFGRCSRSAMDSAAFLCDKSHQINCQMLLLTSSVEEALAAEDSFISPTRRQNFWRRHKNA